MTAMKITAEQIVGPTLASARPGQAPAPRALFSRTAVSRRIMRSSFRTGSREQVRTCPAPGAAPWTSRRCGDWLQEGGGRGSGGTCAKTWHCITHSYILREYTCQANSGAPDFSPAPAAPSLCTRPRRWCERHLHPARHGQFGQHQPRGLEQRHPGHQSDDHGDGQRQRGHLRHLHLQPDGEPAQYRDQQRESDVGYTLPGRQRAEGYRRHHSHQLYRQRVAGRHQPA